jgi:hypothetical protein
MLEYCVCNYTNYNIFGRSGLLALVWYHVSFALHDCRKHMMMWKHIFNMSFIKPCYLSGKRCPSTVSENYMCTGSDKKLVCQLNPVTKISTEFGQTTWFWQKLKIPKFNPLFSPPSIIILLAVCQISHCGWVPSSLRMWYSVLHQKLDFKKCLVVFNN